MIRGLIACGIAVLGGLAGQASSQSPDQQAARTWFLQIQEQAYEAVMPMRVPDVLVAYRVSHEMYPDVYERYFAIRYMRFGAGFSPNALAATVVEPLGSSIQRQLTSLRAGDTATSVPDLVSRLSVRTATVDVDQCKAILSQINRLPNVRVTLPRRDIIALDGPVHQIAVSMGSLKMSATIEDDKAPLVEWAVRTHDMLLGCLRPR